MLLDLGTRLGLAALNALEPRGRVRVWRRIPYGTDERQHLDVYAPLRAGGRPLIVFLPGDDGRAVGPSGYAFVGYRLARAGFAAVIAGYRPCLSVRFPAFVEDAASAIAFVRGEAKRFGGDAGRLYLMGFGMGAHIVALVAIDHRFLAPHGLVSRDLAGVIGMAGPYALRHETSARYESVFAGAGDAARPANLVRRPPPPLLLMHGTADSVVEIGETRRLADAARRSGGTVVLREYEGVGHAGLLLALSSRFARRAPVLDDLAAFVGERREQGERRFAAAR